MNKILLGILIVLLIVSIVLAIVCYCKNKDNYTQTSRETDNYHKAHYWRKIHLTTKDISKIPQYIFDKLHKYAKNYEYKIYNDKACIEYLEKHYGKKLVKLFNTLKAGAHKADLFRYAILYKEGGVYLDIKTDLIKPLREIFKHKDINYSVLSLHKGNIYQGILYSPPKNPLYLNLIKRMGKDTRNIQNNYLENTRYLYSRLSDGKKLEQGLNKTKYGLWYLFKEKCDTYCKDKNRRDRYGYCCSIFDNNNKVFNTRDPKYGITWK